MPPTLYHPRAWPLVRGRSAPPRPRPRLPRSRGVPGAARRRQRAARALSQSLPASRREAGPANHATPPGMRPPAEYTRRVFIVHGPHFVFAVFEHTSFRAPLSSLFSSTSFCMTTLLPASRQRPALKGALDARASADRRLRLTILVCRELCLFLTVKLY